MNEYFAATIGFLDQFKWIFISSNTEYVKHGIIENIPSDWTDFIGYQNDLPNLLDSLNLSSCPISLSNFLIKLKEIKDQFKYKNEPLISDSNPSIRGINMKKSHEIYRLSSAIHKATSSSVNTLIDLGCGLGYLSQTLNEKYNYRILGVEAELSRVETARQRQSKYYPNSINQVHYATHFIGENSCEYIQRKISHCFNDHNDSNLGIVGLHACGDLTVDSLKLFLKIDQVRSMIIMPCCYHKMNLNYDGNTFLNIPLSNRLKDTFNELNIDAKSIITRPFLRLASQQTASRSYNILYSNEIISNMYDRAILTDILTKGEALKKKSSKINTSIFDRFDLFDQKNNIKLEWSMDHQTRFKNIKLRYPNGLMATRTLIYLQMAIQSICENLVFMDRVAYLEERASHMNQSIDVSIWKLFDDVISPRCYAIVTNKIS